MLSPSQTFAGQSLQTATDAKNGIMAAISVLNDSAGKLEEWKVTGLIMNHILAFANDFVEMFFFF